MSAVAVAIGGSAILGGMASSSAAGKASGAQERASNQAIVQNNLQMQQVRGLLLPYTQAGTGQFDSAKYLSENPDVAADSYFASNPYEHYLRHGQSEGRKGSMLSQGSLGAQQDLLGLNGGAAQQAAYGAIENSPGFTSMVNQGENAIRQNASATGGLRGGNTQGALAQFRPSMLAQAIQDQYARLAGITTMSQNSAAGVGNAGMASAGMNANLLQQGGAAQAGAYLAQGNAIQQGIGGIANAFGVYQGQNGIGRGITATAPSSGSFGAGYTPNQFTAGTVL